MISAGNSDNSLTRCGDKPTPTFFDGVISFLPPQAEEWPKLWDGGRGVICMRVASNEDVGEKIGGLVHAAAT